MVTEIEHQPPQSDEPSFTLITPHCSDCRTSRSAGNIESIEYNDLIANPKSLELRLA